MYGAAKDTYDVAKTGYAVGKQVRKGEFKKAAMTSVGFESEEAAEV